MGGGRQVSERSGSSQDSHTSESGYISEARTPTSALPPRFPKGPDGGGGVESLAELERQAAASAPAPFLITTPPGSSISRPT